MIKKKNLWFLTLFSLILVLSIYYITMPNELLITNNDSIIKNNDVNKNLDTDKKVDITESDIISALKVEDNNNVLNNINSLKEKLTSKDISTEEKNLVFEELKSINKNSSLEETIESKIKATYNYDNFVKINSDQIRVVVGAKEHNVELANNIMRLVQEEFDKKMYISVEFQA